MGGRIALHTAFAVPGLVERLVLIGASPGLADLAEREQRRRADEALAERIEAVGVAAFAEEWGAQALFAGQDERVAAAAHADRLRNTSEGLAAALRGLGTGVMTPLWDRLPQLGIPVTLVVGARDAKFRAIAERMATALPDARLHVVEGAGHAVPLERPDAVAAAIG
jgi:2-succinyl-6-hydroxy-2,4-cyclohexadiene-1-carboxylate synthase